MKTITNFDGKKTGGHLCFKKIKHRKSELPGTNRFSPPRMRAGDVEEKKRKPDGISQDVELKEFITPSPSTDVCAKRG